MSGQPSTHYLLFCFVESFCSLNLGDDWFSQLLLSLCLGLFCESLLLLSVVEDGRHVLAGGTASRVMVLPEHFEHCAVVGLLWVVNHLNSLCVVATEGEMKPKTTQSVNQYWLNLYIPIPSAKTSSTLVYGCSNTHRL